MTLEELKTLDLALDILREHDDEEGAIGALQAVLSQAAQEWILDNLQGVEIEEEI